MKTITIFVLLAMSVALMSCDSDTEPTSNSTSTGTISGYVFLTDKNSYTVADKSGVVVTLEGTSLQTLTDASGKWKLTGVPASAYTISFQKQGYGSTKIFGYQFVGSGNSYAQTMNLSQAPDSVMKFNYFSYFHSDTDIDQLSFGGNTPSPFGNKNTTFIACLSTDSAQLVNAPTTAPIIEFLSVVGTGDDGYFGMGRGRDYATEYTKGTKIYCTLCIIARTPNAFSYSYYFDNELNKDVYTAVGPASNILSTVVQ